MENIQKIYTCPMHPNVVRDRAGMCPECGMNLVPSGEKKRHCHGHASNRRKNSHVNHAGHGAKTLLRKFWISLILTIPVVLYSDVLEMALGWSAPKFFGSIYLPFVLGSIVFFYGGWIFLAGAYREIKARLPGMMTLIAIAVFAAYAWSFWAVIAYSSEGALFWELTTLVTIMLLGHYLEMKAVTGAQGALKELSGLLPDVAEVFHGDKMKVVPISELREGDVVFVRPGGRIPSDGVVVGGGSEVNEAMITGESLPVSKGVNNEVIAGTVNGDGSLKIKITKIGEHTFLAGVMRLVEEAQASKSRLQILADRAAFYLTFIAVGGGLITFFVWLPGEGGLSFAVARLVAVLVIACPHALGLAVPLVSSISTTLAARQGFLIKQRLALEAARNVDVVLFDKTGTLTKGEYGITNTWIFGAKNERDLLQIAASVDAHSEHFISKAITKKAGETKVPILEAEEFTRIPGKGVRGAVDGTVVFVGGQAILDDLQISIPKEAQAEIFNESKKGKTIIYTATEKEVLGVFALGDVIREESFEAILALKALGVRVAMITGDSDEVASWVAKELDIDEYFARVLPNEKSDKVKLLQSKGQKVAMVGDGVNDAPALTLADLGVAIGAGTNVAIESAGIILVRNDPRDIVKIIKLSRLTYTKMIQNLFWATGYNIIAMPLAAGVLVSRGIMLEPALAAVFMSLSTIVVAVNAVIMSKKKI